MKRLVLLGVVGALAGCDAGQSSSEVLAASAMRSACFGGAVSTGDVETVAYLEALEGAELRAAFPGGLSCAARAESCEEYATCLGVDMARPCPSDEVPGPTCVDDATLERCFEGFVQRVDCGDDPHGNGGCFVGPGRVGLCRAGTCDAAGARCDGGAMVECDGALERRTDCGLLGGTCASGPGGSVACVHVAEPCTEDRCEDDTTFLECVAGVGYRRQDCAVAFENGRCGQIDLRPTCVPPLPECASGELECDGGRARVCVGGAWRGVDCAGALGSSCVRETTPSGVSLRCVTGG